MTGKSTTWIELAAVKAIGERVKKAEGELKHRARIEMDVEERRVAYLPDGTKVGSISYVKGATRAAVVDEKAFTEWVRDNHPTELVETVRDSFKAAVLADVKKTGEVPPGVDMVIGDPYIRADVKPEQAEAIAMAWAAGELGVDPLRELESGDR